MPMIQNEPFLDLKLASKDAGAGLALVGPNSAAAVTGREGGPALSVEPGDEVGDGVTAAAAGGLRRRLVLSPVGHGAEHAGASDLDGGRGRGAAQGGEVLALAVSEGAERVLPAA